MVILHHFELSKDIDKNTYFGEVAWEIGKLGVILFFVLSGFLITYLLLAERKETGKIVVKNFYVRRILRIWPLYFIIVLGALYVFNSLPIFGVREGAALVHDHFFLKNILYIFFLPNVAFAFRYWLPFANQTWSIGVEEQFYLVWPLLFKKGWNILKVLFSIIAIYLIIKVGAYLYADFRPNYFSKNLYTLISISSFDSMAFGGIAAYLLFTDKKEILDWLFNKKIQWFLFLILGLGLASGLHFGVLHFEYFAILFAVLILNLAANKKVIFRLENKIFNYLGKISYGLYMYHFLVLRFVHLLAVRYFESYKWLQLILVYAITILVAAFSYEYIEKFFIKKKQFFTTILSGKRETLAV